MQRHLTLYHLLQKNRVVHTKLDICKFIIEHKEHYICRGISRILFGTSYKCGGVKVIYSMLSLVLMIGSPVAILIHEVRKKQT